MGEAIAAEGSYPSGSKISLATMMRELDVSRPMAREVLQVLHHKGMVALRSRTGAIVSPTSEWNLLDPDVIQWRLAGSARIPQLNALTELREAVEPLAAYLAALRASAETRRNLIQLSRELRALGEDRATFEGDDEAGAQHREKYSKADVDFHSALLAGSRNEIFAALAGQTAKALEHRIKEDWAGTARRPKALAVRSAAITQFPFSRPSVRPRSHSGCIAASHMPSTRVDPRQPRPSRAPSSPRFVSTVLTIRSCSTG